MKKGLTEGAIRGLKAPTVASKVHYDGHGLGLLVTSTGGKSFTLDYTGSGGKRRRMVLGQWPSMSLDEARSEAAGIRAKIKESIKARRIDPSLPLYDPLDQKRAEKRKATEQVAAEQVAHTIRTLADLWREKAVKYKSQSSLHGDASLLRRIDREMGNQRLADVTPEDVERLKDALADRPIMANRCLSLLSTVLNFAIGKKLLAENPCKGIKKFSEPARRVIWNAERTERLYTALDASDNQQAANAIRLLLWTGARLSEVTGAHWSEFDLTRGIWTKPAERMKTRTDHIIPLNSLALPLLREMKEHQSRKSSEASVSKGQSDLLFDKPNVRRYWNDLRKRAGFDGLHIHDLRHVFASMALENGVLLAAIAPLLGHSSTAMTERYSHLSDRALLDASNKAAEMLAPAAPAKVIPLRRSA